MSRLPLPARALALALTLTLCQVAILMVTAPHQDSPTLAGTYLRLNQWDSLHYLKIARQGYVIPDKPLAAITSDDVHSKQANVVFFPGYPLMVRTLTQWTGLSLEVSLLLIAQTEAVAFWFFVILWIDSLGISAAASRWALGLCLCHPASIFLVVGYTEAPFLAAMMAYLYFAGRWAKSQRPAEIVLLGAGIALAALQMSFIRIVSFALAPFPMMLLLARHWSAGLKSPPTSKSRLLASALLGACCFVGAIVFFAYCQRRFGEWNLYFRLEEVGWLNHRRWFALLDPWSYVPRFFFENTMDSFSRMTVPITVALFCGFYWLERKLGQMTSKPVLERIPLYLTAFVLFYIPLTGKAFSNMDSMIRYTFPTFILLMLLGAEFIDLLPRLPVLSSGKRAKFVRLAFLGSVALSILVHLWVAYKFTHGRWVA